MDGVAVNGAQMRREILGGLYPSAGIVEGLAAVALPTPAMKVRLPAGLSVVDDGQGGFYPVALNTQTDLDIAASSATQRRIDSLIAQVVDNGNNTSTYVYRIVAGTPAGSPVAPTLPPADAAGAFTLRIANINVQINAETSGFVRAQDVTVVAPVLSPVPAPAKALQVGTTPVSFTSQTAVTTATVTFPTAFAATPVVMLNIFTGSGVAAHWSARAINITPTGFQIFVYADTGAAAQTWSAIPVQWMATTP
jgi:hypothetical protein